MDAEHIVLTRDGILYGLEECGPLSDVVSVSRAAFFDLLAVFGPDPGRDW